MAKDNLNNRGHRKTTI